MSFLPCFNARKHFYSSLPAEAFPGKNKRGEDGRTLPVATHFFKTALRVMFDIGIKRAMTSRHEDCKALLHSNFCLYFLFQTLNFLFYVAVNFIRSGSHLLDESRKQCELCPSLTLTPLQKESTSEHSTSRNFFFPPKQEHIDIKGIRRQLISKRLHKL